MSAQLCLALLALSSLTAASDPGCDHLLKPVEDYEKYTGRWVFHAATSDTEEQMKFLKSVNSSWMEVSFPGKDFSLRFGDRIDGKCMYGTANSTTSGNSTKVTFFYNSTSHEVVGRHLGLCLDCVVWTDYALTEENGLSKKHRSLYLFTKTGKLDISDFHVFKKQAECLHFPPEFHFADITNLCPDEGEDTSDPEIEEK